MAIEIGDKCPNFEYKLADGSVSSIAEQIGNKNIVIYFYPKDFTPGCTKEACAFRDNYEVFQELNCEVIGVSGDSESAHDRFAKKHQLPYPLVADTNKKIRNAFGVPKNLFGLIPGRVSYIVDKTGTIRGIFNSLTDPFGHINNGIQLVKELSD